MPSSDKQALANDDPTRRGTPARFQDHRAGQVSDVCRYSDVDRRNPEIAGLSTENAAEDTGRVKARNAHPFHRAGRRNQRRDLAVADESEVTDRGGSEMRHGAGELIRVPRLGFVRHDLSIP